MKKSKNNFTKGIITAAIIPVVTPIVRSMFREISEKMIYTVNLKDINWIFLDKIGKYFKDLPDNPRIEIGSYLENGFEITYGKTINVWDSSICDCTSYCMWNGTPIKFSLINNTNDGKPSRDGGTITLSTIRTEKNIRNVRNFINHIIREQIESDRMKTIKTPFVWKESMRHGLDNICLCGYKPRTFDDVFLPESQEKLLKSSLDNFVNNREWYMKNNIPYHFGILLYSDPGCGKSTLARAIADYIKAELYVFPGDIVSELPKMIGDMIPFTTNTKESYRVILIEDIDCGFMENKINAAKEDDKERKVGLASILNCFDGICAPTNTVYIFTTNHIEKLDPALIRPGRCDIKIKVEYVNMETFTKFCKFHYGEDITLRELPDGKIRPNLTFAELQTEVMKGKSLDEIINYVIRKD